MSIVTKCICDGCGREIDKNPVNVQMVQVEIETGDIITDDDGMYFGENQNDYCESCAAQIIRYIERLPEKSRKKQKWQPQSQNLRKGCPPVKKKQVKEGRKSQR